MRVKGEKRKGNQQAGNRTAALEGYIQGRLLPAAEAYSNPLFTLCSKIRSNSLRSVFSFPRRPGIRASQW